MNYIIKTERLTMVQHDMSQLAEMRSILGDEQVMYAWEHGFDDEQISQWISRNILRYENDGFGYFSAFDSNDRLIGLIGLIRENIAGENCVGIGYIVAKKFWGLGYATEGALGCIEFAKKIGITELVADIRPENTASIAVAKRLGMVETGIFTKYYEEKAMPHVIFRLAV